MGKLELGGGERSRGRSAPDAVTADLVGEEPDPEEEGKKSRLKAGGFGLVVVAGVFARRQGRLVG